MDKKQLIKVIVFGAVTFTLFITIVSYGIFGGGAEALIDKNPVNIDIGFDFSGTVVDDKKVKGTLKRILYLDSVKSEKTAFDQSRLQWEYFVRIKGNLAEVIVSHRFNPKKGDQVHYDCKRKKIQLFRNGVKIDERNISIGNDRTAYSKTRKYHKLNSPKK